MLRILTFIVSSVAFTGTALAIDINSATSEQLQMARGIGPNKAQAILKEREKRGAFKSWDDFEARTQRVGHRTAQHVRQAGLTVGHSPLRASTVAIKHTLTSPTDPLISIVSLNGRTSAAQTTRASRNDQDQVAMLAAQPASKLETSDTSEMGIEVAAMAVTLDQPERHAALPKRVAHVAPKKPACDSLAKAAGCRSQYALRSVKRKPA